MYRYLCRLYDFQDFLKRYVDHLLIHHQLEEFAGEVNNQFPTFLYEHFLGHPVRFFQLIESIILSSNQPIEGIMEELEEDYSALIKRLAVLKCYLEQNTEEVDRDLNNSFESIQDYLTTNISALNKIAMRYYQRSSNELNTFSEYFAIAKAQFLYDKAIEDFNKRKMGLSDDEELSQLVFNVSEKEQLDESELLDINDFTPDEIDIILRNTGAVKSEVFKVSFLSSGMDLNTKKKLSEEQIIYLFNFLKEQRLIMNVIRKTFKEVISGQDIKKPITWTGSQTDAHRLKKYFDWSLKDFNSRFVLAGGKALLKNTAPQKDDYSDLTRFLDKLCQ